MILLIDGQVAWESPIDIADPDRPLGDHVLTLLGLTADGSSYRWDVARSRRRFGGADEEDAILSRIKVQKADWTEPSRVLTPTLVTPA